MTVAALIPAYNEAATIADVVAVAQACAMVDEVVVIDNNSGDDTFEVASATGARTLQCREQGKGQAMKLGVESTDADIIMFLDADLLHLTVDHLERLIVPIRDDQADMTLGLFDRGPDLNPLFLDVLPKLTGQRAMRRELFEGLDMHDIRGYRVEAALNSRADELGMRIHAFVADGLWHRTKEEKDSDGRMAGSARKVAMLATAVWSYASYQVVRPIRERTRPIRERARRLA